MTEQEWQECEDPTPMLQFVQGRAGTRKLMLFACSASRLRWERLSDEERYVCAVGERYADGVSRQEDEETARWLTDTQLKSGVLSAMFAEDIAARIMAMCRRDHSSRRANLGGYCAILRDLFASPFGPTLIDPARQTPLVISLAHAAYEERFFHSKNLNPAHLTVLSDALEEAGCADAAILSHLRSPGPHVRGCWALDLILGKS